MYEVLIERRDSLHKSLNHPGLSICAKDEIRREISRVEYAIRQIENDRRTQNGQRPSV
jgi:hypothetical protein